MHKNFIREQKSFLGRLRMLLCVWFLAGMPLSMLFSAISSLVGVPLPPPFFFLSSLIYLTGGLLGGMWSGKTLRRKSLAYPDLLVALFVLLVSGGFLLLGIVFVVIGLQHLRASF